MENMDEPRTVRLRVCGVLGIVGLMGEGGGGTFSKERTLNTGVIMELMLGVSRVGPFLYEYRQQESLKMQTQSLPPASCSVSSGS